MKIAVIGSGISGLSAAWLLARDHDVTLHEKNARIGGHSNTVIANEIRAGGEAVGVPVDTGFIVYNTACYPNLIALFDHLGAPTAPTQMSFSVSLDDGGFEYSGNGLAGLFGQKRNIFSPRHWMMTRDILRFFKQAGALDPATHDPDQSLGDWLHQHGYSQTFITRHILPMAAAIWSAPAGEMLRFPVAAFARFFANHGLLQVDDRPAWRTVRGGSREYVARILENSSAEVVSGDPVVSVARAASGVIVTSQSGSTQTYDQCVLACHADEALNLLVDPTPQENALLSQFTYSSNEAWLHTDETLMPKRRSLWTSWNYLGDGRTDALAVTYWMNLLQPLNSETNYFVTLNPHKPIAENAVITRVSYEHPLFNAAAMRAQRDLWSLQGKDRLWFAGSYFGYGFHEDGLQSGLAVAEDLGGRARPWSVDGARDRILSPEARQAIGHIRIAAQ